MLQESPSSAAETILAAGQGAGNAARDREPAEGASAWHSSLATGSINGRAGGACRDQSLRGAERKGIMPNHPSPGKSTEITWQLGPTTVYGTLVRPDGPGLFPAVVLVAGSGPTDRDWNSPLLPGTNGSARLLAEALARAGIASLRYDKRASGPHARESMPLLIGQLSMQSHVDELSGAVDTLASQPDIRADLIFALTNSEGALHALHYHLGRPRIPFAGLILTGAPGRPVGAVARSQLAAQVAGLPQGEAWLSLYDAAIDRYLAGEPIAPDSSLPEGVQALLAGLETPANLPFARELWITDAAPLLGEVNVPVLVVIGKKDLQVDWHADGEPLEQAVAGHAAVTFRFPEHANHVLKQELRPRDVLEPAQVAKSYNGPDTRLDQRPWTASWSG
jgi:pimeloyl-ACP methyl ester carboxylesterase